MTTRKTLITKVKKAIRREISSVRKLSEVGEKKFSAEYLSALRGIVAGLSTSLAIIKGVVKDGEY